MSEECRDEWDELMSSSTGKKYYLNELTKKLQSEKPENYEDESFKIFYIFILL
jgi:hypothetical protein